VAPIVDAEFSASRERHSRVAAFNSPPGRSDHENPLQACAAEKLSSARKICNARRRPTRAQDAVRRRRARRQARIGRCETGVPGRDTEIGDAGDEKPAPAAEPWSREYQLGHAHQSRDEGVI